MECRGKNFHFYMGYDACRMLPLNIFIGLFPKGKESDWLEGFQIPFRIRIDITFYWLEKLLRESRYQLMRFVFKVDKFLGTEFGKKIRWQSTRLP